MIHLKQAIYRLRQSGHKWYEDLMSTLTTVGFQRCKVEHTVYYQFNQDISKKALVLYVNIYTTMF